MARQQFPTTKEVKMSYEWILTELRTGLCSPQFSSQDEGVRKLDWRIELCSSSSQQLAVNKRKLGLCLLTDIEGAIIVNYSFSVEEQTSGRIVSQEAKNFAFKRGNMICWSNNSNRIGGQLVPLKNKWEISYTDAINGIIESSAINHAVGEHHFGMKGVKDLIELSENLSHLLKDLQFTDVTMYVKGKAFKAHKNILSARSSVFAAMFRHETKENQENRVEIEDLEPETVQEMLNFIYTGSAPNLPKMVEELLIAADRYELKTLIKMAEKQLISTMSLNNAIKLLVLADMHSFANLFDEAIRFIAANVEELKKMGDWKKMVENQPRLMDPILTEVLKRLGGKSCSTRSVQHASGTLPGLTPGEKMFDLLVRTPNRRSRNLYPRHNNSSWNLVSDESFEDLYG